MANDIGTDFADKEMLLIEPDWIEEIGSRFQVERRLLGYGYTAVELSSINTGAPINLELNYPIQNHENKYDLIDFFNSRKAKVETFWYIHPARFFTLQSDYTANDGYITCVRNYSHLWTQALPSQYDWGIYIKMRNGDLITRKVTGINDSAAPSASYVFLDEVIPRDINQTNHYMIGKMLVGRFDQDELILNLLSISQGLSNVKLQENYGSHESWSVSSRSEESISSTTISSASSESSESSVTSVSSESSNSSSSVWKDQP